MAEYLRNMTEQLYSSFTNSSTVTNNESFGSNNVAANGNFVNFPFVLIPINTFLELQKSGAIGDDVQSYGAFVQPGQEQGQILLFLEGRGGGGGGLEEGKEDKQEQEKKEMRR